MSKFRKSAHDAPERRTKKPSQPGRIRDGALGVYRGDHLVAQVGPKATAVTAARLSGVADVVLGEKDGRPAWLCKGR